MKFGSRTGLKLGWGVPEPQEVNVRIIGGNFIPCRSCHWFSVCVVPKGQHLRTFKEYRGDSDIVFHDWGTSGRRQNSIYYHCIDYIQSLKGIDNYYSFTGTKFNSATF